jgi:sec-independent protein translocase protein TatB
MFFDIGWQEFLLIGAIALVVIGPKDLPAALKVAGYWVRKARTLSREFQSSIDQMIREAELDEMRQELKKATEFDIEKEFKNTIDPSGELAESIKPPDIPDFFSETPSSATTSEAEASPRAIGAEELPAATEPEEEQLPLPLPGVPAEHAPVTVAATAPEAEHITPKP